MLYVIYIYKATGKQTFGLQGRKIRRPKKCTAENCMVNGDSPSPNDLIASMPSKRYTSSTVPLELFENIFQGKKS